MGEPTKPICVRLPVSAHEQLKARAYVIAATPAGVARDLIMKGVAGADAEATAKRLMAIDRRLAAQDARLSEASQSMARLLVMFEALLQALSTPQSFSGREAAE